MSSLSSTNQGFQQPANASSGGQANDGQNGGEAAADPAQPTPAFSSEKLAVLQQAMDGFVPVWAKAMRAPLAASSRPVYLSFDRLQQGVDVSVSAGVLAPANASEGRPASYEFNGVCLVADISGFTKLTERLSSAEGGSGPELVARSVNQVFDAMLADVRENNGYVYKFAGDALLVIFGGTQMRENGSGSKSPSLASLCRAAIRCGLSIISSVRKASPSTPPLESHVGIGAGVVQAMQLGGVGGRWELVLTGEPFSQLNISLDNAKRGEVCISPAVRDCLQSDEDHWHAIKDAVEFIPVSENEDAGPVCFRVESQSLFEKETLAAYDAESSESAKSSNDLTSSVCHSASFAPLVASHRILKTVAAMTEKEAEKNTRALSVEKDIALMEACAEHRELTVLFASVMPIRLPAPPPSDERNTFMGSATPPTQMLASRLHSALRLMQACVERSRGFVRQFLADDKGIVLIAVFGNPAIPSSPVSPSYLAVRSALSIRESLSAFGVSSTIGIGTGRVFSYVMGSRSSKELVVVGSHVNKAARLAFKGARGILACDVTRKRCGDQIVFSPDTLKTSLKGFAGEIEAFEPVAVSFRSSGAASRHATVFSVGRSGVKDEILNSLNEVVATDDDAGRVLLVRGARGVGKTHLVNSVVRATSVAAGRASEQDGAEEENADTAGAGGFPPIIARASTNPFDTSVPYFVIRQLLRSLLSLGDEGTGDNLYASASRFHSPAGPSSSSESLNLVVLSVVMNNLDCFPALAGSSYGPVDISECLAVFNLLIGTSFAPTESFERIFPSGRNLSFEAMELRDLAAMAVGGLIKSVIRSETKRRQPQGFQVAGTCVVALVVEDVMWCDGPSWHILSQLAAQIPTGLKLLLSSRPVAPTASDSKSEFNEVEDLQPKHAEMDGFLQELEKQPWCRVWELQPLNAEDCAELIAHEWQIARSQIPNELQSFVFAESEGIPLLVLELSRLLEEKGMVSVDRSAKSGGHRSSTAIQVLAPLTPGCLPPSDLLHERLGNLPVREEAIVKAASIPTGSSTVELLCDLIVAGKLCEGITEDRPRDEVIALISESVNSLVEKGIVSSEEWEHSRSINLSSSLMRVCALHRLPITIRRRLNLFMARKMEQSLESAKERLEVRDDPGAIPDNYLLRVTTIVAQHYISACPSVEELASGAVGSGYLTMDVVVKALAYANEAAELAERSYHMQAGIDIIARARKVFDTAKAKNWDRSVLTGDNEIIDCTRVEGLEELGRSKLPLYGPVLFKLPPYKLYLELLERRSALYLGVYAFGADAQALDKELEALGEELHDNRSIFLGRYFYHFRALFGDPVTYVNSSRAALGELLSGTSPGSQEFRDVFRGEERSYSFIPSVLHHINLVFDDDLGFLKSEAPPSIQSIIERGRKLTAFGLKDYGYVRRYMPCYPRFCASAVVLKYLVFQGKFNGLCCTKEVRDGYASQWERESVGGKTARDSEAIDSYRTVSLQLKECTMNYDLVYASNLQCNIALLLDDLDLLAEWLETGKTCVGKSLLARMTFFEPCFVFYDAYVRTMTDVEGGKESLLAFIANHMPMLYFYWDGIAIGSIRACCHIKDYKNALKVTTGFFGYFDQLGIHHPYKYAWVKECMARVRLCELLGLRSLDEVQEVVLTCLKDGKSCQEAVASCNGDLRVGQEGQRVLDCKTTDELLSYSLEVAEKYDLYFVKLLALRSRLLLYWLCQHVCEDCVLKSAAPLDGGDSVLQNLVGEMKAALLKIDGGGLLKDIEKSRRLVEAFDL